MGIIKHGGAVLEAGSLMIGVLSTPVMEKLVKMIKGCEALETNGPEKTIDSILW